MKSILILSFLIVSGVTAAAQDDSTAKKLELKTVTTQKVVVTSESTRSLGKMLPKSKTTWTRIKDLFM